MTGHPATDNPATSGPLTVTQHATAVAAGGRALLITGPSGSGKSALALEMMALGAALISDDQVLLARRGEDVIASLPRQGAAGAGLIEARGLGLIRAERLAGPTPVALIIDLETRETARLPRTRHTTLLGIRIRTLRRPEWLSAAALLLALGPGGLVEPD